MTLDEIKKRKNKRGDARGGKRTDAAVKDIKKRKRQQQKKVKIKGGRDNKRLGK